MTETPLEKLIETLCDPTGLTDAEVREELAEQGIDLDAEMARFRPKLDELMRARAVRLALTALKDNPIGGLMHINAAVKAAPVLVAEVERLTAQLEAARVAVEKVEMLEARYADPNDLYGFTFNFAQELRATKLELRRAVGLEE